jgi:hypothetical protein
MPDEKDLAALPGGMDSRSIRTLCRLAAGASFIRFSAGGDCLLRLHVFGLLTLRYSGFFIALFKLLHFCCRRYLLTLALKTAGKPP